MRCTKPFRSYEEQADLLISRGMIADRNILISHLKDVGYYRLNGYWHIFKCPDDLFMGELPLLRCGTSTPSTDSSSLRSSMLLSESRSIFALSLPMNSQRQVAHLAISSGGICKFSR